MGRVVRGVVLGTTLGVRGRARFRLFPYVAPRGVCSVLLFWCDGGNMM